MPTSNAYTIEPVEASAVIVFGTPLHLRVLAYLATAGPAVRARIAEDLDVNVVTLQKHLASLRKQGVIHARAIAPTGDWHRQEYILDRDRYQELVDALIGVVDTAN